MASHCIDTFGRVQLSFRPWADIQSWERFKDIFQEWFLHWSRQPRSSYSPCQAPRKIKSMSPWTTTAILFWKGKRIYCPPWTSPPNIQILKYFAHLDHHLEHLAGYSRSSDLSGAVGNLAKESSKSKVENQRQALQTFHFDHISFAHHCDFLRLWKRGGNFGGNLWK